MGALLKLSIASEQLESQLEVAGQVVWTEKRLPFRAGISFTGATSATNPTRWFDALVAAEIRDAARRATSAAMAGINVFLGPPPAVGALEPGHAEVVRAVSDGAMLCDLVARDAESVRTLLADGRITLSRGGGVAPARWADALARKVEKPRPAEGPQGAAVESLRPREFEMIVVEPDELSPSVRRLVEYAVDAILDGNVDAAERLLRRVQAVAPGDPTSRLILRRIAARQGGEPRRAVAGGVVRLDGDAEAS